MSIKQIKLASGEEIICTIQKEEDDNIIINNAFCLQEMTFTFEEGFQTRGYRLVPWMTYQVDYTTPMLLARTAILAAMIPEDHVMTYYEATIEQMQAAAEYMLGGEDSLMGSSPFGEYGNAIDIEDGIEMGGSDSNSSTVIKGNFTKH